MQPQNCRQRPLQKSMFLPQSQQSTNRTVQMQYQYQDIMKRSSINPDTNKFNTFQFNHTNIQPQTPIHQFNPNSNPILNFSATTRYKDIQRTNHFDHVPQSPINPQLAIQQLQQKINQLSQMVENHDDILKKTNISGEKDKSVLQGQIQSIEKRLKQNVIATMISRETKEIYEHIFNFKLEIKALREEVNQINGKVKNQIMGLVNSNQKSVSTVNSVQKIDKGEEPMSDVGASFILLENKLVQIQKEFKNKNEELKNIIVSQIQKSKNDLSFGNKQPSKIRTSTIQSTLPPIMLEYREFFFIKGQNHPNAMINRTGISVSRAKQDKQILINSTTYFIDREGYLLDSQNRYIVDEKGHQIKLQQNHIVLLKEHNVLS